MSELPLFDPNRADLSLKTEVDTSLTELPHEGDTVERDGKKYIWRRVGTGISERNLESGEEQPIYHTLKSWFSHTSCVGRRGVAINGPGWDHRLHLPELSPVEMLEQYGYVFSDQEIFNPLGREDPETGEFVDGMPGNIPYLELAEIKSKSEE